MAGSHTYLLFGGIALAIIGIILLIGAGVYNGVTGDIDGWFWGLLIAGAVLVVIGLVLLVVGWATAPRAKKSKKAAVPVPNGAVPVATAAVPVHNGVVPTPNHGVATTSTHQVTSVNPSRGTATVQSTHNVPPHVIKQPDQVYQPPAQVYQPPAQVYQPPAQIQPGPTSSTPGTQFATTVEVPLQGSVTAGVGTPTFVGGTAGLPYGAPPYSATPTAMTSQPVPAASVIR